MPTRRRVVVAVGAGLLTPLASFGQTRTRPRLVGWLGSDGPADHVGVAYVDLFKAAMRDLGHVEGRDYRIEPRFAKIFKGASAKDLAIEQPDTYELAINLKTARALPSKFRTRSSCAQAKSSNDRS